MNISNGHVITRTVDTIFIVTINRPEVRNAIDGPTARALVDAFRAFASDISLRVAVLTGAGDTFCSGADLTAIADPERGLRVAEDGNAPLGISRMLLSKPVIAAVEGYAVAGGLELSLRDFMRPEEVVDESAAEQRKTAAGL